MEDNSWKSFCWIFVSYGDGVQVQDICVLEAIQNSDVPSSEFAHILQEHFVKMRSLGQLRVGLLSFYRNPSSIGRVGVLICNLDLLCVDHSFISCPDIHVMTQRKVALPIYGAIMLTVLLIQDSFCVSNCLKLCSAVSNLTIRVTCNVLYNSQQQYNLLFSSTKLSLYFSVFSYLFYYVIDISCITTILYKRKPY